MNEQSFDFDQAGPASAIRFTGNWREFAPIAFTNLLLTIVTLGIYRFWAQARERRYLWSRTEFIDDTLEWTGTGGEMFRGAILVFVLLLPFILFVQFGFQALIVRQQVALAFSLMGVIYLGFFFLIGVARYRALRYRLTRSYWHGIRGGGEPGGWGYGLSWMWKTAVGFLAAGMLVPWSMTSLWNERWSKMSFGPHAFTANAEFSPLMLRWIAIIVSPILLVLPAGLLAFAILGTGGTGDPFDPASQVKMASILLIFMVVLYGGMAVIGVGYWAAFLREAIGNTRLGELEFEFTARSKDWLKLFLGNVGLVIVTLGLGYVFIGYRTWSFYVRHLEAAGSVELDTLTQSSSDRATDAEGLAAAFDIGAI